LTHIGNGSHPRAAWTVQLVRDTFNGSPAEIALMQTALLQLAEDFLTAIVFVIVYLATDNLFAAVGIAVAIGIGQFALLRFRGRSIDMMQYLSIGLVIVLGGISLFFNDPRFVLLKPSAVHFAIAAVMLRRGWLARYMPPIVTQNVSERVITATGYAWATLMIVLGVLNIYVAMTFSIEIWTWWISVGAFGAKIAALIVQFIIFRTLIRRNMRAIAQAPS
jgi:intracellular septation protein